MRGIEWFGALALVGWLGCQSGPGDGDTVDLDTTPGDGSPVFDHPSISPDDLPQRSAGTQRLSVAQLRGTFPVILGTDADGAPVEWLVEGQPGLDLMANSLGEADYIELTTDILDPSPLYAKFMDDAVRAMCGQASDADMDRPAEQRVLSRYADTEENLRYLYLRFLGVKIAEDDTTSTADLRAVYDAVAAAADDQEGWYAVCVALGRSPELHVY
jgi:hypothetical protein